MNDLILDIWRNYMQKGTQCLADEKYTEAEYYFSQSIYLARQLRVPEVLAFTIRLLATVRVKLDKLDLAETGFRNALRICEEVNNAKGMSEAWAGLASISLKRKKLEDAADKYQLSIKFYPKTSPPLRLAMLYSDLGQVYMSMEDWEHAREAYFEAKDLCCRFGYAGVEAELDILLGEIAYRQGDKEQAQQWLKRACQIFGLISDWTALANTSQYLAFLYYDQEMIIEADICQSRAVALYLRGNAREDLSESCYFLSKIKQYLSENEEAEYYLELSVQHHTTEDVGLALRYQSLATLTFLKMDLAKAEKYYLKALRLFEQFKDDMRAGEIYEALAFLVQIQGREGEAIRFQQKSVEKLKEQGIYSIEALLRLASYYEKRHRYLEALHYFWQALEICRDKEIDAAYIEKSVQRVSQRVRRKNKIYH